MNKKYNTVTIGIPAFNEQNNIGRLLTALSRQKTTGVRKIVSIIVLSDGSSDKTVIESKRIKNPKIKVIEGRSRKGKNARLNELYKIFTTDILVTLDADIVLEGEFVIDTIAKSFKKIKNPGLIAGNAQPLAGKTIFEEASNNFIESLNFIKSRIKKGQNILSVRGPILAYSQQFAKQHILPPNVPDDRYSYFASKRLGLGFYFEAGAKAYFRSPKTFSDQISQCKRFREDRLALNDYIDIKELTYEYFVPFNLKFKGLLLQVIRNPLAYFVMKIIQIYDHLSVSRSQRITWDIAKSTKSFL